MKGGNMRKLSLIFLLLCFSCTSYCFAESITGEWDVHFKGIEIQYNSGAVHNKMIPGKISIQETDGTIGVNVLFNNIDDNDGPFNGTLFNHTFAAKRGNDSFTDVIVGHVDENNILKGHITICDLSSDDTEPSAEIFEFSSAADIPNCPKGDLNGDCRIGLEEATLALQIVSGLHPIPDQTIQNMTQAIVLSQAVVNNSMSYMAGIENIATMFESLGLQQISSLNDFLDVINNTNFQCGTITKASINQYVFDFSSEDTTCKDLTGKIILTINADKSILLEFQEFGNSQCIINGTTTLQLAFETTNVVVTLGLNELTICGQTIVGQVSFIYNLINQTTSIELSIAFDGKQIEVKDISSNPTDGTSGSVTVEIDGATYGCTLTNVKFDTNCGIPNSGAMTINGTTINFDETSCENPTVTVMINGKPVTMDLQTIINMYTDANSVQKVANVVNQALSESQNTIDGLEQVSSMLAGLHVVDTPQKRRSEDTTRNNQVLNLLSCAEVLTEENITTLNFISKPQCLDLTGSIIIEKKPDDIFSIDFINVVKDACEIDGNITSLFSSMAEGIATADLTFKDMTIFNKPIEGTHQISFDSMEGTLLTAIQKLTQKISLDGQTIDVPIDLSYDFQNGFNGKAVVDLGKKLYQCVIDHVQFDPIKGLPIAGNVDINDIKLKFEELLSNNSELTYMLKDIPAKLKLIPTGISNGAKQFIEKMTQLSTQVMADRQFDMANLKKLSTVISKLKLADIKQMISMTLPDAQAFIQDFSFPCGTVSVQSVQPLVIVFSFDNATNCPDINGIVTITMSDDHQLTIDCDNLQVKDCLITGSATTSFTIGDGAINMPLNADSMTICGQPLGQIIDFSFDPADGHLITAQKVKDFISKFKGIVMNIPTNITYDKETGLNGSFDIPFKGKTYACALENIHIEPKCGLPISGSLVMNDMSVNFDEMTCDNREIRAKIDDLILPLKLKVSQLSEDIKSILSKVSNITTAFASGSNLKMGAMNKLAAIPPLLNVFPTDSSNMDISTLINNFAKLKFNCGSVKLKMNGIIPSGISFVFNGNCNDIEGVVSLTYNNGFVMTYEQLNHNGCILNGSTSTKLEIKNGGVQLIQNTDNLTVCNNHLNGTAIITSNPSTGWAILLERTGQDILTFNDTSLEIYSNISYTKEKGLSGTATFTMNSELFECQLNNMTFDVTCRIPTGGTIKVGDMILDFSETTCDNQLVAVTMFGLTTYVDLKEIISIITNNQMSGI